MLFWQIYLNDGETSPLTLGIWWKTLVQYNGNKPTNDSVDKNVQNLNKMSLLCASIAFKASMNHHIATTVAIHEKEMEIKRHKK